jgi:hypothetical protein
MRLSPDTEPACGGCAGVTHTHTCGDPTRQPQLSPGTGIDALATRPVIEVLQELSDVIDAVRGDRVVIRVSGLLGDSQDVGIMGIDGLQELIRRTCDALRPGAAQQPSPEAVEAGAQALANDVWLPPQRLEILSKHEADKFRRQARLVLEAIIPVTSTDQFTNAEPANHGPVERQPLIVGDDRESTGFGPMKGIVTGGPDLTFSVTQTNKPVKCSECDTDWADPPSKLCPGCQAYREHQR